jgi:hypothetical protein
MAGVRYVSAWDEGERALGAHWVRDDRRSRGVNDSLDSLMQMDHVIRVDGDGLVHDDVGGVYAPEVACGTDKDGQILAVHERGMIDYLKRQGWDPERGWSGQQGTTMDDVIMHTSEFIGGSLAEHILDTPGYWVACTVPVEDKDGTDVAGWVLVYREIDGLCRGGDDNRPCETAQGGGKCEHTEGAR